MKYCIRRRETVPQAFRRIATHQIESAIVELTDPTLDRDDAIHSFRKRCKKVRGLLRLVRPYIGDIYSRENARFRDLSRELSEVRDSTALIEAYHRLIEHFDDQLTSDALSAVQTYLEEQKEQIVGQNSNLTDKLEDVIIRLQEAKQQILSVRVTKHGFDAIEPGLLKTYRRGRAAMKLAYASPRDDLFHEWRKRVKYHWYHTRLLRRAAPELLENHRLLANELGDVLGEDHDFAVLRQQIMRAGEMGRLQADSQIQILLTLLVQRQGELRSQAWQMGRYLFAESPKRLGTRWRSYWETWHEQKPPKYSSRVILEARGEES